MDKENGEPGRSTRTISRDKILGKRLTRAADRLGYQPLKVWRPNLKALHKLTREVAQLAADRPLTAGELRVWSLTAKRLYRRQRRAETLISREQAWRRQIERRLRLTACVANARSLDRLLDWLLSRKDGRGKNPYARALARQGIVKLGRTREDFAAMGRKGADARWHASKQWSGWHGGQSSASG
jgi:hypothetical protein